MNYERLTQWLAGPVSTLIGLGASALTHSTISHAQSLSIATFVVGAGVTFLAHQKWLTNLVAWWQRPGQTGAAPSVESLAKQIIAAQEQASQLAVPPPAVPPSI